MSGILVGLEMHEFKSTVYGGRLFTEQPFRKNANEIANVISHCSVLRYPLLPTSLLWMIMSQWPYNWPVSYLQRTGQYQPVSY